MAPPPPEVVDDTILPLSSWLLLLPYITKCPVSAKYKRRKMQHTTQCCLFFLVFYKLCNRVDSSYYLIEIKRTRPTLDLKKLGQMLIFFSLVRLFFRIQKIVQMEKCLNMNVINISSKFAPKNKISSPPTVHQRGINPKRF